MSGELSQTSGHPEWFEISRVIERVMMDEKRLNSNVDFFSATVYAALGLPVNLFTPIFAMSRTSGWTAHVLGTARRQPADQAPRRIRGAHGPGIHPHRGAPVAASDALGRRGRSVRGGVPVMSTANMGSRSGGANRPPAHGLMQPSVTLIGATRDAGHMRSIGNARGATLRLRGMSCRRALPSR